MIDISDTKLGQIGMNQNGPEMGKMQKYRYAINP